MKFIRRGESRKISLGDGSGGYSQVFSEDWHYRVHDGTFFSATHYVTGIATSGVVNIGVATGDYPVHIIASHVSSGDALIQVFTGVEFTGGTAIKIMNHNMGSDKTYDCLLVHSPTISEAGTSNRDIVIPGGTGGHRIGGISPVARGFVIPPETQVIYKFTNLDGNDVAYNFIADFYEEIE